MLDLIVDIPGETIIPSAEPLENIIFTQPGMRYCQAQALVHSLAKDEVFAALSEQEKNIVSERILEEVRGRMMEDIVLLETSKSDRKHKRKIKHSDQIIPAQMKYLIDEEKLNQTSKRFGDISKRCVLYRGENMVLENGIAYRNVEEYLKEL